MKFKLKTDHPGMLMVTLFYAVVGVVLTSILVFAGFRLFHVGVLAVLNLMLAYGLFKMRKWSVKLLSALFLPQVVFGVITFYYSVLIWTFSTWETTAFNLLLIVYVVLCFVSLVYVLTKRKDFK